MPWGCLCLCTVDVFLKAAQRVFKTSFQRILCSLGVSPWVCPAVPGDGLCPQVSPAPEGRWPWLQLQRHSHGRRQCPRGCGGRNSAPACKNSSTHCSSDGGRLLHGWFIYSWGSASSFVTQYQACAVSYFDCFTPEHNLIYKNAGFSVSVSVSCLQW